MVPATTELDVPQIDKDDYIGNEEGDLDDEENLDVPLVPNTSVVVGLQIFSTHTKYVAYLNMTPG